MTPATPQIETQSDPEVFGTRLASGVVPAERRPDGTIVVKNLPFFSEIRPDDPGVKIGLREPRDRAWLERALKKHQARRVLGEKPALNLRHLFDEPERVGEYELTHCEPAQVNPDEEPRWTLFGDKVYESLAAFEKSKDHDFRSAEISPDSPEELSAVALLRSKMPCHRYPNVKERLAAPLVEAFEAWSGKGWQAPQVWRGGVETFAAAADTKNTKRFDDVVSAIERGEHGTKEEGHMPPTETKTDAPKAPSIDEKMEEMAAAFMAKLSKHFEGLMKEKYDSKPGEKDEKPEAAEAKPEGDKPEAEPKKDEKGKAPDAVPAVHQALAPETFAAAAAKSGHALLTKDEKLELLGLRSYVKAKQADEQVETFAAAGEAALVSAGVAVDPEIRAELRSNAKDFGKPGVDRAVAIMTRFAKNAARAPEMYGALAGSGPAPTSPFESDVKKAVETFGALPDRKQRIYDLAAQFRAEGETFVRSLAPGEFLATCQGTPSINPAIQEARGGFRRGN